MPRKNITLFIYLVGSYLILTNIYAIAQQSADTLDYIGLALGFIHLIFGYIVSRKIKREQD